MELNGHIVVPDGLGTLLSFSNVIVSTWAATVGTSAEQEGTVATEHSMSNFLHRVLLPLHKVPNATLPEFLPELHQCVAVVVQAVPRLGADTVAWLLRRLPLDTKKAGAFLSEIQMIFDELPPHPRAEVPDDSSADDEPVGGAAAATAEQRRALWGPCEPAAPLQLVPGAHSSCNLWRIVVKLAELAGERNASIAQLSFTLLLENPIASVLGDPDVDSALLLKVHSLLPHVTDGGHWCDEINQMSATFNDVHAAKLRSALVPGL